MAKEEKTRAAEAVETKSTNTKLVMICDCGVEMKMKQEIPLPVGVADDVKQITMFVRECNVCKTRKVKLPGGMAN